MAAEIVFAAFCGFILGIIAAGAGIPFLTLIISGAILVAAFFTLKRPMAKYIFTLVFLSLAGSFYLRLYGTLPQITLPWRKKFLWKA